MNMNYWHSIISCPTCGRPISRSAKTCPGCGAWNNKRLSAGTVIGLLFLSIFLALIINSIGDGQDATPAKAPASDVGNETATAAEKEPEEPPFESVTHTIGGWGVTVTGFAFEDDVNTSFITAYDPGEGNSYAVVYMSVINNGKEANVFLPYLSFGNSNAVIKWGEYEYSASSLLGYDDDLTIKSFNPLVRADGIVAFVMPDSVIESGGPFELQISDGSDYVTFDLTGK